MKNLVFGLVAMVLFANLSFGQKLDASNSKNEFDNIGKAHNDGLAKIIENKENVVLFKNDDFSFTMETLNELEFKTEGFINLSKNEKVNAELGEVSFSNASLTNEMIDDYYKKGYISADAQTYLTEILSLVTSVSKGGDFNDFKNKMIGLETKLDNLKGSDREFLLSVASISRYSVAYWSTYEISGVTNRGSIKNAAVADLAGAVGGGVRYGIGCLFAGPFGWGALGVACLASGLGGSAAYGIRQLF